MITMHGALHPKSDNNRIYLSGGRGGRGRITNKICKVPPIAVLVGWLVCKEKRLQAVKG